MNIIPNFWTVDYSVKGKESKIQFLLCLRALIRFFEPLLNEVTESSLRIHTSRCSRDFHRGFHFHTPQHHLRWHTSPFWDRQHVPVGRFSGQYNSTKRFTCWPSTNSEQHDCIYSKSEWKTPTVAGSGLGEVCICHALCHWRRVQEQTSGLSYFTSELRSRQIFMSRTSLSLLQLNLI